MKSPARHPAVLRSCVVALVIAALLALPSLSGGAPVATDAASTGLVAHFDPAEGTSPLDLFGVRFGQTSTTNLTLIIRTYKPWSSSLINPPFGRTLCLILRSDEQTNPSGRLCAYPNQRAPSGLSLRYTVLDPTTGAQIGIRDLTPVITRPNAMTLRVTFPPALLRLKPGLYHWYARSQYRDDGACAPPAGCQDLLPDSGEDDLDITISVSPAAMQRCFGAASRDVRNSCVNPKLAREVTPTPDAAIDTPNLPCTPLKPDGLIIPCQFGVPSAQARNTVALIGDSHASHWRAALEYVSQELKWAGVSITRSGCPLTRATAALSPPSRQAQCTRWNKEVPRWLARNRQVSTVFVVAHFDAGVVVKKGRDEFQAKEDGFSAAWKSLPRSVKRIIVIRDTPQSSPETLECVRHAMLKHERAGIACALPRAQVLSRDAAAAAANREHSPRIHAIDLSSFFCSAKLCYPVIGGALVYKDVSHLTDVFSSSLGPYLLRKIRALNGY